MESQTFSGPKGLTKFAQECASDLFAKVQYQFIYPKGCSLKNWPVKRIKAANEAFLKSLRNCGNVYAIFVRPAGKKASWSHMYVGERKSAGLRQRMTEHLIDKDDRTGSMLAAVKTAVSEKQSIGLSFIKVEPESLRLFVEETIIAKHKQDLPWNTQG